MNVILPLRAQGTLLSLGSVCLIFLAPIHYNEHYANFCIASGVLSTYWMLLALTLATPYPDEYLYYYDGMLLVMLYLCGLSGMLAKPTLLLVTLMLLLALLVFNTEDGHLAMAKLSLFELRDHDSPMGFMLIFSMIGYFISLQQEITTRETFLRTLTLQQTQAANLVLKEQSRLQAELQNQEKSKFIAHAAHDLRNVMQPIGLFLNLCESALARQDLQFAQNYLNEAITANRLMCTDVNALLDISELESGIINLNYNSFDIRALAAQVLNENKRIALDHNVSLCLSRQRGLTASVYSDRQHLKRVISNLLVNAVKYSNSDKGVHAKVAIAIIQSKGHVRIDIIDNGIGIPESKQNAIFKPFYQLNNLGGDKEKGGGTWVVHRKNDDEFIIPTFTAITFNPRSRYSL